MVTLSGNYYTTRELARLSGFTDAAVLKSIQRGKLKAVRLLRGWLIHEDDARAFYESLPASRKAKGQQL